MRNLGSTVWHTIKNLGKSRRVFIQLEKKQRNRGYSIEADRWTARTCAEDLFTVVAARREVVLVALGTVELVVTHGELDVGQRLSAVAALEARSMPVMIVVLQVLSRHTAH